MTDVNVIHEIATEIAQKCIPEYQLQAIPLITSIIQNNFANKLLPNLIEPPRKFNWARQNYCSGWNQCVHEMRKRLGVKNEY